MDLMDFDAVQGLYFEEDLPPAVAALIDASSEIGAGPEAEAPLLEARALAPDSYSVLVALYRYYYFTHRYADALPVGEAAVERAARALNWPTDWTALTPALLSECGAGAVSVVRFLLFALKGTGYLHLRLDAPAEALARLSKVAELDEADLLGAAALIPFAERALDPESATID